MQAEGEIRETMEKPKEVAHDHDKTSAEKRVEELVKANEPYMTGKQLAVYEECCKREDFSRREISEVFGVDVNVFLFTFARNGLIEKTSGATKCARWSVTGKTMTEKTRWHHPGRELSDRPENKIRNKYYPVHIKKVLAVAEELVDLTSVPYDRMKIHEVRSLSKQVHDMLHNLLYQEKK